MRILIVIGLLGLMIFHSVPSALIANDNNTYHSAEEPDYEEAFRLEDAVWVGLAITAIWRLFVSPKIKEYLFGDANTEQFPKNKDRLKFTLINEKEVGVSFEKKF
jgi:hypothetical protein